MPILQFLNESAAQKAAESIAVMKNVVPNSIAITSPEAHNAPPRGFYTLTWEEVPVDLFKRLKSKRRA